MNGETGGLIEVEAALGMTLDEFVAQPQDVHEWFSLSYANYLVLPRLAMSAMPLEWQHQMTALLNQINERFETPTRYTVLRRGDDGKIMKDPWADYRYGSADRLTPPTETEK